MPINFSLRKYKNPVFIETGTHKGDGVNKALLAGFKKIFSIELGEKFYNDAVVKFSRKIKSGQVVLVLGDSSRCLPGVLEKIDTQATFWLDAHFSSGDTARGIEDVPLLKELNSIGKHSIKTHTILIDDVRLFGTKKGEDWSDISLDMVIGKLKEINKDYSIHYEKGIVKNDVLVAEICTISLNKILGWLDELILNIFIVVIKPIAKKIIKQFSCCRGRGAERG